MFHKVNYNSSSRPQLRTVGNIDTGQCDCRQMRTAESIGTRQCDCVT